MNRSRYRVERAFVAPPQHYLAYDHEWRTHLSLDKDAPVPASCPTASLRNDHSSPSCRRFASPLRTSRRLTVALGTPTQLRPLRINTELPSSTDGAPQRSGVLESRVGDLDKHLRTLLAGSMEVLVGAENARYANRGMAECFLSPGGPGPGCCGLWCRV